MFVTSYRERRLLLIPHLLCEPLEVTWVVVGVAHVLGDAPQVPVEHGLSMQSLLEPKNGT